MGLREVSAILWRERHLLELLLFKLDEEQLVLAAGRTRWLPRATREVEMVLEEIRQTELERAVEVSRVAVDLGLPAGASLRQLAEAASPPWQGMLAEHRQAFLSLTDEVTALVQANRELLGRGQKAPSGPEALGRWKIQFCQAVSRPKILVSSVSGPTKR
jgi:hypothetical protein